MFPPSLLAALLLAVAITAKPIVIDNSPVTLPLSRRFNLIGPLTILERDQARAAALKAKFQPTTNQEKRAVLSVNVTNQATIYTANVGVGSPATQFQLIIDTGSSNTWVGAGTAYVQTSTSTNTGGSVSVTYGSGSFSGTEFIDQVTIGNGLVIPKQSIGVASTSSGFQGVDGIIGIGPVDLTAGTVSNANTVPTVTDNLFANRVITSNLVSVSFNPTTSLSTTNGELTFGGTDSTKFTGSITFSPKTRTSPANQFWGINESITYGSTTILSSTAGIVDTGTTLVLLASDAFSRYQSATGGVADANTGLLRITSAQFSRLQNLNFNIASAGTFTLTPNAQIWPRALNTAIGGTASSIYLIVNDLGTPSGQGLDFINGFTFLERFYTVFDTANNRIGFATTRNTNANTN